MPHLEFITKILTLWFKEGYSEGELTIEPEWYVLWEPSELEEINQDYKIDQYAPGFTSFGGNGGGELFVINENKEVFYLPTIGMNAESTIKIAGSLEEFKSYIIREDF